MQVEVEFPQNRWIKVTGIRFYSDTGVANNNVNDVLDAYETQYGRRIRDYLHMLFLAVGNERSSSRELMPPFKGEEIDSNEYKYLVSDRNLFVKDNTRWQIKVKIEKKGKGFFGLPRTKMIKLAEVEYREMKRELA